MTDCIFVTYEGLPDLDPHDRLIVDSLRARNVSVQAGVWSDPSVDWASARMCVLRSTWDYHTNHAAFMEWLDRTASQTIVRNDPALVRWNSHKFYLRDLERAGVPVVPTAWLERGAATSLDTLCAQRGWGDIIIKPAFGASSHDVLPVKHAPEKRVLGQAHLDMLLAKQDVLVQPFLHTIAEYPERALIFIDGAFSHAVAKTPFQTALPTGEAGDAPLVLATDEELRVAAAALDAVEGRPLFARIDLVRGDNGEIYVLELELIEPTLFLSMHPPSAQALADAIVRDL